MYTFHVIQYANFPIEYILHAFISENLGAAVAMLAGVGSVQGVVRFLQVSEDTCVIDGTVDGLSPGLHGIHIHEFGDLSMGCER